MDIREINMEDTWEIRHKVMWPDKELNFIKLENDEKGLHYGIFEKKVLISVISLFIQDDRAQFRKFATLKEEQGKGYGSRLLDYLIEESKDLGVKVLWCNARENKAEYYQRFGFAKTDKTFEKSGVKYVIMERNLY